MKQYYKLKERQILTIPLKNNTISIEKEKKQTNKTYISKHQTGNCPIYFKSTLCLIGFHYPDALQGPRNRHHHPTSSHPRMYVILSHTYY